MTRLSPSPRARPRILEVARTIVAPADRAAIDPTRIAEATGCRRFGRI
jgi:hypothetical protein